MSTLLKYTGTMVFDPPNWTKKHRFQSSWKRVALIKTGCDLDLYYSWFLKKRFNLPLNRSLRGSHITFISDRMDVNNFKMISDQFNGKEIDFYINPAPKTSGKHWWLEVVCPDAESIRELAGLSRIPYFNFHLTIGYPNDKMEFHSEYIMNQIQKFEL